jgi:site-specific DNA recombinase
MRKSTEHNLDLAFNWLDAQREACEAHIKSQSQEGWLLVRDRFDGGGLSAKRTGLGSANGIIPEIGKSRFKIDPPNRPPVTESWRSPISASAKAHRT